MDLPYWQVRCTQMAALRAAPVSFSGPRESRRFPRVTSRPAPAEKLWTIWDGFTKLVRVSGSWSVGPSETCGESVPRSGRPALPTIPSGRGPTVRLAKRGKVDRRIHDGHRKGRSHGHKQSPSLPGMSRRRRTWRPSVPIPSPDRAGRGPHSAEGSLSVQETRLQRGRRHGES
jgi:hypothetical protein